MRTAMMLIYVRVPVDREEFKAQGRLRQTIL